MLKIATIVSHPIQYHAPLYRRIAATPGVDFTALFLSDFGVKPSFDKGFGQVIAFDVPLLEGYRSRFVSNVAPHPRVDTFTGLVNPELVRILHRERYDAIWVHGWAHSSSWMAFAAARLTGTPYLLKGDSSLQNRQRRLPVRVAKRLVIGGLLRDSAGVLYVGEENRRFYEFFGVRADRLFFAPFGVDNAFFAQHAAEARASGQTASLRARVGAGADDVLVLFVAKLQHATKRPLDLVEAMRQLGPRAVVAFVGEGPARPDVEAAMARSGVRGQVVGFANQSELPAWYAAADVLSLPSGHEPWGLVVNEAMACALPAVVSDRVGCAADLVLPGETGAVHRAEDPDSLAAALRPMVEDSTLRQRLATNARLRVAQYDVSKAAEGIVTALRTVARR